jgi:hypothetical protein
MQVAAQLQKILDESIEFTPDITARSEAQPEIHKANKPCMKSIGRLFGDAAPSPGGHYIVCWQSEYTAANSQTPADATKAAKLFCKKRQTFVKLKVCAPFICSLRSFFHPDLVLPLMSVLKCLRAQSRVCFEISHACCFQEHS